MRTFRRPASWLAAVLFTVFWVGGIAEAWCPMHDGRALGAADAFAAHAVHPADAAHAAHAAPVPPRAPDAEHARAGASGADASDAGAPRAPAAPAGERCTCPGDCAGPAVATATPAPRILPATVARIAPKTVRLAAAVPRPVRPQLRLPFATAPPVHG